MYKRQEYEKLRREQKASTTPVVAEWKPWGKQLEPGHFFVDMEDLPGVRAWFLSEETVAVRDNKGEANVLLDRRVGARPSCSQFLFPDGLCKEAFEEHEDKCCVPRQIAAVLKVERTEVCRDMDSVQLRVCKDAPASWQDSGRTPRMVVESCRAGCSIVHNKRVVESFGIVDKIKL